MINIDLDFARKIGATHFLVNTNGVVDYYRD